MHSRRQEILGRYQLSKKAGARKKLFHIFFSVFQGRFHTKKMNKNLGIFSKIVYIRPLEKTDNLNKKKNLKKFPSLYEVFVNF